MFVDDPSIGANLVFALGGINAIYAAHRGRFDDGHWLHWLPSRAITRIAPVISMMDIDDIGIIAGSVCNAHR